MSNPPTIEQLETEAQAKGSTYAPWLINQKSIQIQHTEQGFIYFVRNNVFTNCWKNITRQDAINLLYNTSEMLKQRGI
jgi:hypothetical protein